MKHSLLFLNLILTAALHAQSFDISPQSYDFKNIEIGKKDSISFTIKADNMSGKRSFVLYAANSAYALSVDSITTDVADEHIFTLFFEPDQNINYNSEILVVERFSGLSFSIDVNGNGKLDSYYSATFNKWDEDLKKALKGIIDGHSNLGYNTARDRMFMNIDNQKENGAGATKNTLTCIYTGRTLEGYSNRQDAQGSSFNTEHTFPQSKFCGSESGTQKADMHHLFITDNDANSRRGNYPFGNVSGSTTWSEGGSKLGGGVFEPRDEQKGATARAMMYFVTRYENCNNFFTSQEQVLRNWAANYKPTLQELNRNDAVEKYQGNRNPYVDFPAFVDRISSLSSKKTRTWEPSYLAPVSQLNIEQKVGDTLKLVYHLVNNSNKDFTLNSISLSGFSAWDDLPTNVLISKGEDYQLSLNVKYQEAISNAKMVLSFDNGLNPLIVSVNSSKTLSINNALNAFEVYPNNVDHTIYISHLSVANEQSLKYQIVSMSGQLMQTGQADAEIKVNNLPKGPYVLILDSKGTHYRKLIFKK